MANDVVYGFGPPYGKKYHIKALKH